jgi:hypothetical protein
MDGSRFLSPAARLTQILRDPVAPEAGDPMGDGAAYQGCNTNLIFQRRSEPRISVSVTRLRSLLCCWLKYLLSTRVPLLIQPGDRPMAAGQG